MQAFLIRYRPDIPETFAILPIFTCLAEARCDSAVQSDQTQESDSNGSAALVAWRIARIWFASRGYLQNRGLRFQCEVHAKQQVDKNQMTSRLHAKYDKRDGFYSKLADDPDLKELVAVFVQEIPTRVAALIDCLADGNWETLGRLTHQFKSAVGSYGFDELVPVANRLEVAVREGDAEDAVADALTELVETCRRVRTGSPRGDG